MKSVIVGTAGHIDHGKSALVRALTGIDPDRLKEEKERGITIDLGFAHLQLAEDLAVGFVDVPGHERFVKNMLAGVGGIDLVLLVVAGDESVMPQTREHFDICRLLHIPAGLVAITKVDLIDREVEDLVRLEVRELLRGSFMVEAPIVAVSSRTGAGLDQLRVELARLSREVPPRPADGLLRLPIDRVFSMKGFGTVVTGTLIAGTLRPDREVEVLPAGRRAKVRAVQVHGQKVAAATAGQRTAVNLGGIDVEEIARGDVLVDPETFAASSMLDARLEVLPHAPRPLAHGTRVRFHHGTSEVLARVRVLGPAPRQPTTRGADDARAGDEPPGRREIVPGESAFVQLRLERPTLAVRGDRFIVRSYSPALTVGGGIILDGAPPKHARRAAGGETLRRLEQGTDEALGALTEAAGAHGQTEVELAARLGRPRAEILALAGAAADVGRLVRIGGEPARFVGAAVIEDLAVRLRAAVQAHHAQHPLTEGISREELRARIFAHAAPGVAEHVFRDLASRGAIAILRDLVAAPGYAVTLTPEEEHARQALEAAYRAGGLRPPELAEVAGGAPSPVFDRMLKLLIRDKILVKIADALVFHREALEALKRDLAALKPAVTRLDVGAFKARYGVTRKFAIPLLEFLDRERVTRRQGDERIIL